MSGRFVAARMMTSPRDSKESIEVSSWLTTLSVAPPSPRDPRFAARESISSMNITVGALCLAFLNISRMAFSDSPTHLERTSGPLTDMKLAPLSFAAAFAISVLPTPGGPYSRMPRGGSMPRRVNDSGLWRGVSTASFSFCLTSSMPPMSSQLTRGGSVNTSRSEDGSTSRKASLKSSLVTWRFSRTLGGMLPPASRSISGR